MRILYAIQGTGNGHLSRALEVVPLLQQRGQVDVLVSGPPADIPLPFPVRYRCHGLGFIFGKKGGINFVKTFVQLNSKAFLREVRQLPVEKYDLVISDFEPVSAWACQQRGVPCVALSHQAAVLSEYAPQPASFDPVGRAVLRHYAPATRHYGFHFQRYEPHISTPVIRRQVRELAPRNDGHYTVYLPAFDEENLVRRLRYLSRTVQWQVFSKHSPQPAQHGNVQVWPVSGAAFTDSLARSAGVLCGAGFETPAEALYLGKKLLVLPMKQQYEQACNAAALAQMGIPVVKNLKDKSLAVLDHWLQYGRPVPVDYPDETAAVLDKLLLEAGRGFTGEVVKGEIVKLSV
ncbi:glycosyltransferase family protein [Hymenobacter endophyticus]|uniref:Glycosyltransferase family protein n=1 Tax=Hymenobacter endophyticus TaxID=3076335 RepID=A0ABU3TC11_9BACT|nr:glycosyltransferase family protein [Hymenobacter endophyticus]MDU0368879.1 glycosyltransferase family protein [Hymenobacter endophyticus]